MPCGKYSGTIVVSRDKYDLKADEDLVRRVSDGDENAFAELYGRHHGTLLRFAWRMTGSAQLAEEAVQETFLALIEHSGRWRPERGPLRAYLFGITRNQVLRQIGDRAEFEELAEEVPQQEEDLLAGLAREERVAVVQEAVRSLPVLYREVTVLCGMEGMSYEEAAVVLGCPVGTVRSRLYRGKQILAVKLRHRYAARWA